MTHLQKVVLLIDELLITSVIGSVQDDTEQEPA